VEKRRDDKEVGQLDQMGLGPCGGAVQCSAVQCSAVQCSAVQCSAVQCSAVQCSAVQCSAVGTLITSCRGATPFQSRLEPNFVNWQKEKGKFISFTNRCSFPRGGPDTED
jgi:hypothetical protein